jgi:hypothetical protein
MALYSKEFPLIIKKPETEFVETLPYLRRFVLITALNVIRIGVFMHRIQKVILLHYDAAFKVDFANRVQTENHVPI